MTPVGATTRTRGGLTRIGVYYALFAGLIFVLARYFPVVQEAMTGANLSGLGAAANDVLGGDAATPIGSAISSSPWHNALVATISMLGALTIMVPVTWVYMLTRERQGYLESVVHTLLILPVTVTGIVMIVKSSVALAFSLAGIVAAVRFRTTLDDTKDAVYVFLAIGVGLASGVQAVGVAIALSIVFNGVILLFWVTRFGNVYADARPGSLGLGDVIAGPESAAASLVIGDPALLAAAAPEDLSEVLERHARIERHISEERVKKKRKRANALLLVYTTRAQAAQGYVEEVLNELASRWKLAEMSPTDAGFLLTYLARLDDAAVQGAVMDRLRNGETGTIQAAELRSLKGIKPRA